MIEFGTALPADREALKTLWLEAFEEDEAADADAFLTVFFKSDRVFVVRDGTAIVSMLFLLEQSLRFSETATRIGYVYAGATSKAYRGQGLYRRLLDFAASCAAAQGLAALFLHPADARLAKSYERMGFTVPMTCSPCVKQGGGGVWRELSPTDYRMARTAVLKRCGVAFVDWDETVLTHAMRWCRAVASEEGIALIGEKNGVSFAWESFGAVPLEVASGRTVGDGETVGLMRPIGKERLPDGTTLYMGYGLE